MGRRLIEKQCEGCNGPFLGVKSPGPNRGRFCSKTCANRTSKASGNACALNWRMCKQCDKEWIGEHGSTVGYCSDTCRLARQRKAAREWQASNRKPPSPPKEMSCLICSALFRVKGRAKYCSSDCNEAAKETRRSAARAEARSKVKSRTFQCEECGAQVITQPRIIADKRGHQKPWVDMRRRFCSALCNERNHVAAVKRRRDAQKRGAPRGEAFSPAEIFMRDGWRCQLCGISTPAKLRGSTDARSPQLDHILPLAAGGTHTRANVQLACRRCNQAKGATPMGQTRLIG